VGHSCRSHLQPQVGRTAGHARWREGFLWGTRVVATVAGSPGNTTAMNGCRKWEKGWSIGLTAGSPVRTEFGSVEIDFVGRATNGEPLCRVRGGLVFPRWCTGVMGRERARGKSSETRECAEREKKG
jgi:hypothetical protein